MALPFCLRWSSPTDLTHPLDPFTSRYIHGKLDPVEQHVQGVTDAIQVARQKLANTHQFLQQSKQKRDATVDKLRNIPKDPSDWFIDVCRRGVVVPLRRTFPEDDRCEEVKTEAKKRLMLQFGIDEGVFPTKLIVKEITVQQNDSESDFAAVFIFKEKTADESQDTVALSGSYIRKMLTTDKSLRWRFSHVSGEF
nr:hypothetical protein BaRGS_025461 [Batillaria attramentaria]